MSQFAAMSCRSGRHAAATVLGACLAALCVLASPTHAAEKTASVYTQREADWRNGAIVYQVFVDRFAPPANLEAKRHLYPAPKALRDWAEQPQRGSYVQGAELWSHEIDFWGGDLASLAGRLDYVQQLGADVLYLNPIHLAYTNHKYDAQDYLQISPEYGSRAELRTLIQDVHQRGMKIVLDGVFNHMGRKSPMFQRAAASETSPTRQWFVFGPQYPGGARSWYNAQNLPELNLENPAVRDFIFAKPDSVVQSYLADGIDGWRLDVAYEIGPNILAELTRAAHRRKPGSLTVGEVASYPKNWMPALDAVMNFTLRDVVLNLARGTIAAPTAARMIERTIAEAGIEPTLKSWLMLDNHDNWRLATELPKREQQRMAQVLQFTLPGSPNLYYGTELGMTGGEDPAMRGPMRWDWVTPENPHLQWTRQLIALRKAHRALRVGDFRPVTAEGLLAFERYTDRVAESVIVLLNPGPTERTERVLIGNSFLMNGEFLVDALAPKTPGSPPPYRTKMLASMATVTVPAGGFLVLTPDVSPVTGYTPYKRVP